MPALALNQIDFQDKKVLVRCDFNVPLEAGKITDPTRIDASLDTIRYIIEHRGAAILCSHLGRPKERTLELSLKPVAEYLGAALGRKVALAPDCIGDITGRIANSLPAGQALLLENLRFHGEEEANDRDFAHELARGKQVYVNDAFGAAHRAHASTVGVTRFIATRAAGFLMMRELEALKRLTENPEHPYAAIMGGAKVSDKIGVLKNLIGKVDSILIGGAMAYTFLKARGIETGKSRVEEDKLDVAREILAEAEQKSVHVLLPIDHVVADAPEANATAEVANQIGADKIGLDIGPQTRQRFIEVLQSAKTVVWNGPLGFFEIPAFAQGTLSVGEALSECQACTVIGGGDIVAAVGGQPWAHKFSHISTGGGATLEFLEGRELPGVKALSA